MTEREKELVEFIRKFRKERGYSPTIKEIALGLHTKSTTHVRYMLLDLKDKGVLTYVENSPRTIVLKE